MTTRSSVTASSSIERVIDMSSSASIYPDVKSRGALYRVPPSKSYLMEIRIYDRKGNSYYDEVEVDVSSTEALNDARDRAFKEYVEHCARRNFVLVDAHARAIPWNNVASLYLNSFESLDKKIVDEKTP